MAIIAGALAYSAGIVLAAICSYATGGTFLAILGVSLGAGLISYGVWDYIRGGKK